MKNMNKIPRSILIVTFVLASWLNLHAQQSEITLLAVGPMRAPTQKIVANFEAKTGSKVKVTFGNGAETRRMVAKGQGLDVSLIIAPFPGAIASGTIDPKSAGVYRRIEDLDAAERLASKTIEFMRALDDVYHLPQHLALLAGLESRKDNFVRADELYAEATDVMNALLVNVVRRQLKTF